MWAMAGPAATRVLADYGATVVRVESEHKLDVARGVQPFVANTPGVENGGLFIDNNTGKLGLALDLANPAARDVVLDLVRWADVVCESFSPRAMRSWGFGYEALREVNPDIVMLSSCLMGQTGPLASFSGFGNLAAAISGFHTITGWPDRAPSGPYSAYTDYVSPRFTVAVLLAALDHRARTGQGQHIDFSQAEACLHLLGPALLDYEVNGRVLGRDGNRHPEHCPHGVFPCRARGDDDDRWIAIAVDGDEAWARLAAECGRADLAGLSAAERHRRADELEGVVGEWTAALRRGRADRPAPGLGRGRPRGAEQPGAVGRPPARPPRPLRLHRPRRASRPRRRGQPLRALPQRAHPLRAAAHPRPAQLRDPPRPPRLRRRPHRRHRRRRRPRVARAGPGQLLSFDSRSCRASCICSRAYCTASMPSMAAPVATHVSKRVSPSTAFRLATTSGMFLTRLTRP